MLFNVRGGDVEGARRLLNEKETCAAHLLPCLTAVLNNDLSEDGLHRGIYA